MQQHRPPGRPVAPWALLAAAFAAAVALWMASVDRVTRSFEISGNGRAMEPTESTSTSIDPVLLALGFGILAFGAAAAALWLARRTEDRKGPGRLLGRVAAALVVVGAVTTATVALAEPDVPGATLESIGSVIAVMDRAGLECERRAGPVHPPSYSSAEARCLVPWTAAVVRGGQAVVVIDLWRDSEARESWTASPIEVGGAALVGESWLVRCEFRSICLQLRPEAGGRTIIAPPGQRYDLTSWRYYEKPFGISVEHGITGHFPPTDEVEPAP